MNWPTAFVIAVSSVMAGLFLISLVISRDNARHHDQDED